VNDPMLNSFQGEGCANYSFHWTNVINYPVKLLIGK